MSKKLHIAIDAHWLVCWSRSGISTYLNALLSGWTKSADELQLDLLVPFPSDTSRQPAFSSPKVKLLWPARPLNPIGSYRAQLYWQQIALPKLIKQSQPDVYLSPFHLTPQLPRGVKTVTTIHDLCFLSEPHFSLGKIIHRAQLWSGCLKAARLICISHSTFNHFARQYPRHAHKAEVVHNGIDAVCLPLAESRDCLNKLCPDLEFQKFLLWVGFPAPRKNMDLLFEVFKEHQQRWPDHKFVIVTMKESHEQIRAFAQARGFLGNLRLFSNLADVERDALYRCALALVFPSQCEGFGYPSLEAMHQGCPSFSLRGTAMEEMLEGVMPLVNEPTTYDFTQAIQSYMALPETSREHVQNSLIRRAGEFSAQKMAANTLDLLRRVAG